MSAFDKIIGYEGIKTEMKRFCDVLQNSEKYKKIGVTLPGGILFYGNPGIGKTLIANCFIEECGCKAYTIRKNEPDGAFIQKIQETFEQAKKEPEMTIVFLDDMDKFANEDSDHPDAEEYVTVQACIDESRDSNVFVIATINEKCGLPKSLLRTGRFDRIFEMKAPGYDDTLKIIKSSLENKSISDEVEIEEIAGIMAGHSISDMKAVINDAGIMAGFEGRLKIEKKDVIKAIIRLLFEASECELKKGQDAEIVLFHEIGHVLTSEYLIPGSVKLVSIEAHSGDIEGITVYRKEEDGILYRDNREKMIIRKLGGMAATEMIFGIADRASSDDLDGAYTLLWNLISSEASYGFSFLYNRLAGSGDLTDKRETIIAHEMERHYQKAKQIIAQNRDTLMLLAEELRVKKTMTEKEIQSIIRKESSNYDRK